MKEITTDVQLEAKLINSLLEKMSEDDWNNHTTFKDWTPAEVVAHLYYFDLMAIYSYKNKDKFKSEAEFLGTTGRLCLVNCLGRRICPARRVVRTCQPRTCLTRIA